MPLPSSINDLSTTPASNSPAGSESPTLTDDYLRYYASYIAALRDVVLSGTSSLTTLNLTYTGTLTGSTGIMNIGAGQIYKNASGSVGIGGAPTYTLDITTSTARAAVRPSIGTNSALFQAVNTGGTAFVGLDSSAGGLIASYALCLYHAGAYPIGFATNNAERMRIDASGNVLIGGVSTPATFTGFNAQLQAVSSAAAGVAAYHFDGTKNVRLGMFANSTTGAVGWDASYSTGFVGYTWLIVNAEQMRLDGSGNLGIGRTPTVKLDVNGAMALPAPTLVSTGTYTVLISDASLRFNSGACVLTLPNPANFNGRILRVFQCLGSGGAITSASSNVYPQGGASLGTAILPAAAGKWADLQSDGVSWWITASN